MRILVALCRILRMRILMNNVLYRPTLVILISMNDVLNALEILI